MICRTKKLPGK